MESVTSDEDRLTYFREMPREERKNLGYVPVVYPAGFLLQGKKVYICCGKDDCEIIILTMDLQKLVGSLVNVEY